MVDRATLERERPHEIEAVRLREREYKAAQRKAASVLTIPAPEDPERRALLESDDEEWLRWYFGDGCGLPDPFTYVFTTQQREILHSIGHAIRYGGDQALAASRGEGKTTIATCRAIKAHVTGEVSYTVLFASTGPMAENILDSIDTALTENDRLLADYPEVCIPVRELQGAPQRANTQRANGVRLDNGEPYEMAELSYSWCGNELIFPRVPGSPSAGSIIATRGLDAAVRGLKKRGKRPQLAIIDDPDTEDTARSEEQAAKLEKRIDAAIGGLGGQKRSIGRVILTTLQSRKAVSFRYTDPKVKPTFKGRRYRFLITPPERADMWADYVAMRIDDLQRRDEQGNDLDPHCRRSHAFYAANRAEMDAGAVVSNPNRFDDSTLPDGSQSELSALQHYYNQVAKLGPEVVATEYDNDPPEESADIGTALNAIRIQKQVSGYDRQVVPHGVTLLTFGADIGKSAIHWVVRGWSTDGSGFVVDYGVHEVRGTMPGRDDGVDVAIQRAIGELVDRIKDQDYANEAGEVYPVSLSLFDAGYRTEAVYAACQQLGAGVMPVMGFGKSSGCTQANFSEAQRSTADKRVGNGWFLSRKSGLWLVCADADRWKAWEHDRWLSDPDKPGALHMWGRPSENPDRLSDDQSAHHSYARHIVSESEVDEVHKGSMRRRWKAKSANNHWLDASWYASVAMSVRGLQATATASKRTTTIAHANTGGRRPTLAELARGGRR